MAIPNCIIGRSRSLALTTVEQEIVKNIAGSNSVVEVSSLFLSNIHASAAGNATVKIFYGEIHTDVDLQDPENPVYTYTDITYNITSDAQEIANKVTLNILKDNDPIYLQEGASLRVVAAAADTLTATVSYKIYS